MSDSIGNTEDESELFEQQLARFELAWRRGERPSIKDHLIGDGAIRIRMLAELIQTDLEFRLKAGDTARVENYLENFAEIGSNQDVWLSLLRWEYRVRRRLEPGLHILEYQERFPQLSGRLDLLEDDDTLWQDGPRQQLAVNSQVGNYLILKLIGAGGMGQVYQAYHQRMGRQVALKVVSSRIANDPQALERFFQEVKVLARLTHPNIVAAYDADEINGTPFFVMEYVEGVDLSRLVKNHGPLSIRSVLECTQQAAQGLSYAHKLGVIHRDIKPANLLLSHEGIVKILDVGLARFRPEFKGQTDAASGVTNSGTIMGTPDYMSPEQAVNSKDVDQRADIYSLGCTLFYLLAGKPPYAEGTPMQRLIAHREQPIPPLHKLRPDLPQPVVAVVRKMLAKQAGERYQTMREVADAVSDCLIRLAKERSLNDVASDVARQSTSELPLSGGGQLGATAVMDDRAKKLTRSRSLVWLAALFILIGIGSLGWNLVRRNNPVVADEAPAGANQPGDLGRLDLVAATDENVAEHPAKATETPAEKAGAKTLPPTIANGKASSATPGTTPMESGPATIPTAPAPPKHLPELQSKNLWKPGPAEGALPGIVARPAVLPGIRRWQLESRWPRASFGTISINLDRRLAFGGLGGTVRLMKLGPPVTLERLLVGHSAAAFQCSWQPVADGRLATADSLGQIRLWSSSGELLKTWESGQGPIYSLFWNGDGTRFATGGRAEELKVWTADGEHYSTIKNVPAFAAMSWGPEARQLTTVDNDRNIICLQDDGQDRTVWLGKQTLPDGGALAWDPFGKHLVALEKNGSLRFWNRGGELLKKVEPQSLSGGIRWRPDGELVATTSTTSVQFWTPQGEPSPIQPTIPVSNISDIAWSPSGPEFAISSFFGEQTLQFYDGKGSSNPTTVSDLRSGWSSIEVEPDSGQLLSTSTKQVALFSREGNRVLWAKGKKPAAESFCAAFQTAGKGYVIGGYYRGDQGENLEMWNAQGELQKVCLTSDVRALAVNPNSGDIASAGPSGRIHIWSPNGTMKRELPGHTAVIDALAWSPDGQMLASFGKDNRVRFWPRGEAAGPVATAGSYDGLDSGSLSWNRHGFLAAAGDQIQVWNTAGELQWTSQVARRSQSVAWRPDGKALAILEWPQTSADPANFNGRVLIVDTNDILITPPRPCSAPDSVAWSTDGTSLYISRHMSTICEPMICEDAITGTCRWSAVACGQDGSCTFTGAGQLQEVVPDLARFDAQFVYLVEELDGSQQLVEPGEFRKRFADAVLFR